MHAPRTTILVLCCLAPLARPQARADIDFAGLAAEFRAARSAASTGPASVDAVLAGHFARLDVGGFEVDYPTEFLAEKKRPDELQEVLIGILDLQRAWLEHLLAKGSERNARLADVEALRDWIAGWKPRALRKLGRAGGALDLFDALRAPAEVRRAQGRLHELLHDAAALGIAMRDDRPARVVLSPDRLDFMRWLAFAAEVEPSRRGELHVDGCDQWTQFWTGWTLVLAMEYASWSGFDPEFRSGKSMKSFEDSGLVEQISLQVGMALVRHCTHRDPLHAENGLVMNFVIDCVGQLNTIDGEGQIGTSGARTQPYSRFVPGGNPRGGTLPKRSAAGRNVVVKSQWRRDNGEDYFFGALVKGQKAGAKLARKERKPRHEDELAHFALKSSRGKWVVSAPFFGAHAAEQPYPPQAFLTDYGEFFRAYKAGFYRWLRSAAIEPAEGQSASLERFRELIQHLDEVRDPGTYERTFQEVYGVPLSAADGETDSMEWRFLGFLAAGGR